MPANLPPGYYEAERRYKQASTPEEKVTLLEELISTIPKHKGTDHLRADLRRKLSRLKDAAKSKKKQARYLSAFHIEKEGAGQVVVTGAANVGKSALVASVTHASLEVADYPFTTWSPAPGMMNYENIQIQLIDTPAIDREYVEPELVDLIRRCHVIVIIVDITTSPLKQLERTALFLKEHRIFPLHQKKAFNESGNITFLPVLVAVNKVDNEHVHEDFAAFSELLENKWPLLPISVQTGRNIKHLKQRLFALLNIIRVYSRKPGQKPDYSSPFVLTQGSTVEDFAGKVHQDFSSNLKDARVWGSADFDGQMVSRDFVLADGDIVELRM